jgi:hypothetical protein
MMSHLAGLHCAFVTAFVLLVASNAVGQQAGLVSINNAATNGGNGNSLKPASSADGRFIAFESQASDLTFVSDTNGTSDVFVRDQQTGITILVSVNATGTASANGISGNASISANGRFVAFESTATNLVALSDTNNTTDIFVRDLQTGVTRLVSLNNAGDGSGNAISQLPIISANGRTVVFQSNASNLTAINDTNNQTDVFARDLQTGTTALASVNSAGTNGGTGRSSLPSLRVVSDDGRFVVFQSEAGDLVANDTNGSGVFNTDVFVRDLQTATTTLVTANSAGNGSGSLGSLNNGAQISGNGRFVAFESRANNLVTGINEANNGGEDIFVRDLVAGTTVLASINVAGTSTGNNPAHNPSISADGRYVAFQSDANNLVPNDNNNGIGGGLIDDVFVRDLQLGTTALVSVNSAGTDSGGSSSTNPQISASGRFVLFLSGAPNLTSDGDFNNNPDIFLRDLQTSRTTLISRDRFGTASGVQPTITFTFILSRDGLTAAFSSTDSDLTFNDQNSFIDVFSVHLNIPVLQLSQASYSIAEGAGSLVILVNRSGDPAVPVTVSYATSDAAAFLQNCNVINGVATSRCDYVSVVGTLRFAANETSKIISIPIVDDTYLEGAESFSISLSNPTGSAVLGTNQTAPISITDNGNDGAGQPNPIDNPTFFVRQHYIDFLSREPDPLSAGWVTILNGCGAGDQSCRLTVSQGIYSSPEFRDRGYFIYKFYSVALGRKPTYDEFNVDRARVSGFQTAAELEQSKVDFIADFMSRTEFANIYNGLSNNAYVQRLFDTAGVTQITVSGLGVQTVSTEQQLLAGGRTRAQVLRDVAESPEVSARFLTESTVVMHYFGYLRRDPDAFYQGWINILNSTGDIRNVTSGFINSAEYRARFGQ